MKEEKLSDRIVKIIYKLLSTFIYLKKLKLFKLTVIGFIIKVIKKFQKIVISEKVILILIKYYSLE